MTCRGKRPFAPTIFCNGAYGEIMKKIMTWLVLIVLAFNLTGCESVQKKFRRKKKEVKMPRFYQEKKYIKQPTPELYKKHYSYWVTWQAELIKELNGNTKRIKRSAQEAVANLEDMQAILVPEKASEMQRHIDAMKRVRDEIMRGSMTFANKDSIRITLEREDRYIKRDFCYSKVKGYLRKSFDEEPALEADK